MIRTPFYQGLACIVAAATFASPSSAQTLSQKYFNQDMTGHIFQADVCYHSSFEQMQLKQARFEFKTVMRFCNFFQTHAEEAEFSAFMYAQKFVDSNLSRAVFRLKNHPAVPTLPSEAQFINTNLEGAAFYGDVSRLQFQNSSLLGVTVNGLPCEQVLEACRID